MYVQLINATLWVEAVQRRRLITSLDTQCWVFIAVLSIFVTYLFVSTDLAYNFYEEEGDTGDK